MRFVLPALLAIATIAALSGGLVLLLKGGRSGGGIDIVLPTQTPSTTVGLKVYVTGAVKVPGVYDVDEGARLTDVMEAAGGPTGDADLAVVNLAARVRDEEHWHIPRVGEAPQAPSSGTGAAAGMVDLNSATVAVLMSLPGIGEVKATSIVRYREANGPFSSVDELLAVNGIGPATLEGIRDLVDVR